MADYFSKLLQYSVLALTEEVLEDLFPFQMSLQAM